MILAGGGQTCQGVCKLAHTPWLSKKIFFSGITAGSLLYWSKIMMIIIIMQPPLSQQL